MSDPVLILLHRPEGYEDTDAQIVAYEAIRPEWRSRAIVAGSVAAERSRIASLLRRKHEEVNGAHNYFLVAARMVEGGSNA